MFFGKKTLKRSSTATRRNSQTTLKKTGRGAKRSSTKMGESRTLRGRRSIKVHNPGARGATVKPSRQTMRIRVAWILKPVLSVGMLLAIAYLIDWRENWNKVSAIASRPLTNIIVQGDFKIVTKAAIEEIIQSHISGDFIDMNLEQLKLTIEGNSWVEHASLKRIWPDSLVVKITEQKPIARWGASGFINQFGDIVNVKDNSMLSELPVLYATGQFRRDITDTYLEISETLSGKGLVLTGIQVDDTLSWEIVLNKEFLVVLGQEDILQRLKLFLYIYQYRMGDEKNNIRRVDMRYESGMAVEWKTGGDNLAKVTASMNHKSNRVN